MGERLFESKGTWKSFWSQNVSKEPFEQEKYSPESLSEVKRLSPGLYFLSPQLIKVGNFIVLGLLFLYLTINAVFYDSLYELACDYVNFWSDIFLDIFTVDQISTISDVLVYYTGYGMLILSVVFQPNRFLVTLQAAYVCFGLKFGEILKLVFFDGRPIYVCNNVYTGWCSANLGMPASHVLGATTVYLWILLFIVIPSGVFQKQKKWGRCSMVLGVLCFPVIVDITRLIMGAHTFMQDIAGYLFGAVYTWLVYSQLIPFLLGAKTFLLYWKWHLFTWIFNSVASAILVKFASYTASRNFPKAWVLNLTEKACDMDYDDIEGFWAFSSLLLFPWLSLSVGFMMSIGYKEYFPTNIPLWKERENWVQYRFFWLALLLIGILLFFYESSLQLGKLHCIIRPALFYLIGMSFARILKGKKHPHLEI